MSNQNLPSSRNSRNLSGAGYLVFAPVSILALPVTVLVTNPTGDFLKLLMAGLFLTSAIAPIYLLFVYAEKKLYIKSLNARRINFVLAMLITGGCRGWLLFELVRFLELKESGSLGNRIFASIITTLFWLSAANILINYSREFKTRYQKTLAQYLQRNLQDDFSAKSTQKSNSELVEIQSNLSKMVPAILGRLTESDLSVLADRIRTQINQELRPLSERIWVRSLNEYPSFRFSRMFRDSIKFLEFNRLHYFLILSGLAFFNNAFIRSPGESLLRTVTFLFAQIFIVLIFRSQNSRMNAIFLICMGVVPVVFSEYVVSLIGFQGSWVATFAIAPVSPAILIVLSLLNLTKLDRELLIDLLKTSGADFSVSHQTALGERNLASFIHNSLQSELLALASQLETVARDQDYEESSKVLARLHSLVGRSFVDDFAEFTQSPLQRLDRVCKSWSGILDISIDIKDEFLFMPNRNLLIVQLIEEFAANSFRHGKATRIWVSARENENALQLDLHSNGSGLKSNRTGLGTQWLDQIALGNWRIEETFEGISLYIEI